MSKKSKCNSIYNKISVVPLLTVSVFASCGSGDTIEQPRAQGGDVYIQASAGVTVSTRAPYQHTAPSVELPLDVTVWASSLAEKYNIGLNRDGSDSNAGVSTATTVSFQSGEPQLVPGVRYPDNSSSVYFVAMHPADNDNNKWTVGTTTTGVTDKYDKANFTFHGHEDVLFAPEKRGKYGQTPSSSENPPKLSFNHLLTWLRVYMQAESEEVAKAWGKLKKMTIKSKNHVSIDVSRSTDDAVSAEFSVSPDPANPVSFDFYATGKDDVFPGADGYGLTATMKEVAYVLCSPVEATDATGDEMAEYEIVVETENRTVAIPIDLEKAEGNPFTGNTMGHQFTLKLTFKLGVNIAVSAKVEEWKTGVLGSATITP